MKKIISAIILGIFLISQASLWAAEGPMEKFADKTIDKIETNCQAELETYCQTVTPGQGRGVACLYAHSDKISPSCLNSLQKAEGAFKNAVANVNTMIANCMTDILALCSKVAIGEGRILACLEEHKDAIAPKCQENIKNARGDLGKEDQVKA